MLTYRILLLALLSISVSLTSCNADIRFQKFARLVVAGAEKEHVSFYIYGVGKAHFGIAQQVGMDGVQRFSGLTVTVYEGDFGHRMLQQNAISSPSV